MGALPLPKMRSCPFGLSSFELRKGCLAGRFVLGSQLAVKWIIEELEFNGIFVEQAHET